MTSCMIFWIVNYCHKRTFTSYPSIIIMTTTGWDLENWTAGTLQQLGIRRNTLHIVHKNWISSWVKVCIWIWLSSWERGGELILDIQWVVFYRTWSVGIFQLFTNRSGISSTPWIVTNCPPLVIDTHFHSTLIFIHTANKADITIGAIWTNWVNCYNKKIFTDIKLLWRRCMKYKPWHLTPASW